MNRIFAILKEGEDMLRVNAVHPNRRRQLLISVVVEETCSPGSSVLQRREAVCPLEDP